MKKKAIEKIPFLKLKKTSSREKVKFIGVTAIIDIAKQKHFILEVYKNQKECRETPVIRIVVNSKDFGSYITETGTWTRGKITTNDWYDGLIWEGKGAGNGKTWSDRKNENILYSKKDLENIKSFFGITYNWHDPEWWMHIARGQSSILTEEHNKRLERIYEKRRKALKERENNTPPLPEQEILNFADNCIFYNKHYLYYKKHGPRATICCTACGGVLEARWKDGETIESFAERHIEEPIPKHYGICPMCQESGLYMPQGRMHSSFSIKSHVFLAEKYKEKGIVMRYVEVEKEFQLEVNSGQKGIEMVGALEKLSGVEIVRTYFLPGENPQTDYHKHSCIGRYDFWDDCDLQGMAHIRIDPAVIMPKTYENIKGTFMEYCSLKLYENLRGREVNAISYLKAYQKYPQIELLLKMNLPGVVDRMIPEYWGNSLNLSAKRPEEFLNIRKEKVRFLCEQEGRSSILNILQIEKQLDANWTEEQVLEIEELDILKSQLERALPIMSIQKLLNNIAKYAGCEYGTNCASATGRLRHTKTLYFDYLSMRAQLGYNLENTVYQKPKDLNEAHNKLVNEIDKELQDKRLKEVAEKYPLIRKNYRKLRKRYFQKLQNLVIRPARSAEEIVTEGRMLHHCVGGDNYLKKHNSQESIILFLRFEDEPDVPYITVEIKEERIIQWYGAHDTKPDQANIQKWLEAYVTRLKCERLGIAEKTEEEVMQAMIMPA